jgi:hypothetical protein
MKNDGIVVLATNNRRTPDHCGIDPGPAGAYWTLHLLAKLAPQETMNANNLLSN